MVFGLVDQEEFQFALFRNSKRANLFADRVSVSFPFSHLQEETELVFTVVGLRSVRSQTERSHRFRGIRAVAQCVPP